MYYDHKSRYIREPEFIFECKDLDNRNAKNLGIQG